MAKSASGKYQGSLSLEWFNKQKAILLQCEADAKKEGDIPAPRINWINRDDALFYEIDEEEGKGLSPYWVDRNDIRVKEARPLVFKKAYIAEAKDKKGSLPGVDVEYKVKESKVDDPAIQNWLIKGDNLLVLNALKRHFDKLPDEQRVKCIYIDPPYNIDSALNFYEDNFSHSEWLTMMRDRLVVLREMLKDDGSIWVSIDDSEMAYFRVLMDEVFGREAFVACNVWQKRYSRENRQAIGDVHEYILTYAKNPLLFKSVRNLVPPTEEQLKVYKNPNHDPKGRWRAIPITAQAGHATAAQFYEIISPSGKVFTPPEGRCWGMAESTFLNVKEEGRIWFGINGDSQPNLIRYLSEVEGYAPWTWWPSDEVGHTDEAKKESHTLFGRDDAFSTPKPERLLERIIHIATNPGELVLDCFSGSGTTQAVAHKMGRHWIGVEVGSHSNTHIIPRLIKVIGGDDQGGISEAVGWHGGGSFKYFHLGPSIIHVDKRTGKGEFNWKLGREFLQESLLQSYDFVPDAAIEFNQDLAGGRPAIGRLESAKGLIVGVAWLVAPDEPVVSIDAQTVQALYNTLKGYNPRSIHVFTNKGWDIKQDAMLADMEIIKVPHAIFAELER